MMRPRTILFLFAALLAVPRSDAMAAPGPTAYYIDSRQGDDRHSGTDSRHPWKSLARLQQATLYPGDSIRFKRGAAFTEPLYVPWSGDAARYITMTDYGRSQDPAPSFTNPVFRPGNYGNCIRVSGSYVIVEHLFCSGTAACTDIPYSGGGWLVWEMGAIHIDSGAAYCIVRNNEIKDCVAGIRSNGPHTLITHNYLHDCNRVLKQWNWGPIGIWLGADHQEVAYNRVVNYSAVDPRIGWGPDSYGSGADGGAVEIDDARYNKTDISIHHNYTRDCQGFLEVTWTDVKKNPLYRGFHIHHNTSDDYQQFVALWCGEACLIEHNTIIRRKVNANDWGVFNITQRNGRNIVRDNIVVTEKNIVLFNTGRKGTAKPNTIISHNLYYAAADSLKMGREGPGDSAIIADPLFVQYRHGLRSEDFFPRAGSPALKDGAVIGAGEYRQQVTLAENGKAMAGIRIAAAASATEQFAARELSVYLAKISGAAFPVHASGAAAGNITLAVDTQLPEEDYSISIRDKGIFLSGGSGRAVLYAAYDLLHRLGCVWLAPSFSYYEGRAEYIPRRRTLRYGTDGTVYEHPRMAFRKLDIEEGRTHTIENLQQMIDWMPKVRLNVLMAPLNYQGAGRVRWDNWREALVPGLKKRGLLIEVGGHGYQNFINARIEGNSLFIQHPEWFGKNKNSLPDSSEYIVFNTAHPDAVRYFIKNIIAYLRVHPEIDIFDCWPPDMAKWAECPETAALGTAADRQAVLMNQVDSAIRAEGLP
ncbi:MAG: hypothetical protein JST39_06015, partial [Bacteroidetes bacterium]|nr:hypothetical protein [Bacteroidota bacterium]